MEQMYNVSSNPHVRDKMTTSRIMQLVVIALLPTTLFGIWNFGFRALLVVLVTVASSVFFEWLYNRLMHKKNTINDFSAVVTGLLLALNMPPQIPLWMPVLGSAFAIIVVKQLFGGLGQNFIVLIPLQVRPHLPNSKTADLQQILFLSKICLLVIFTEQLVKLLQLRS